MRPMPVDVKSLIQEGAALTDHALEELIPSAQTVPASIHGAMRHSVFAGGKRIRPVLAYQAAVTIAGACPKGIAQLGAALEMLHTYSLIHDDLPALDNDDLRRGKPTCHVAFGEAIAILAGDALQTRAFEVLAGLESSPAATVKIIGLIANAVGTVEGMILEAPRGTGGFGYDPLFYLPSLECSMAEIDLETKLSLSHRGRAIAALLPMLRG